MMPRDAIELYQKVHEPETPAERTEVQLQDKGAEVPDINRIADYRKPDDEMPQAKEKFLTGEGAFDGEDTDINAISFAVREAAQENKLYNKEDQDAVTEVLENDFPALVRWGFGRKPNDAPTPSIDPNSTVEDRMLAARGMPQDNFLKKAAEHAIDIYRSFRREFRELDPNKNPREQGNWGQCCNVCNSHVDLRFEIHIMASRSYGTLS